MRRTDEDADGRADGGSRVDRPFGEIVARSAPFASVGERGGEMKGEEPESQTGESAIPNSWLHESAHVYPSVASDWIDG